VTDRDQVYRGPLPVCTTAPTINGQPTIGQVLTVSDNGVWQNGPVLTWHYAWTSTIGPIPGATAASYMVTATDLRQRIRCYVTGRNASGGKTVSSNALLVVPFVNITAPAVTGTPAVGQLLLCSNGQWMPPPASYSRQWLRNGSPIAGASSPGYTPLAADVGALLQLQGSRPRGRPAAPAR
jgi:hypothetical protein